MKTPTRFFSLTNRQVRWPLLAGLVAAGALSFLAWAQAQSTDNEEDFYSVFVGWDFSGMSPEEELAVRMALDPEPYNQAIEAAKTPEERTQDAVSRWSITDPTAYAGQFPVAKSAAEIEAESEARFAMENPIAYSEALRLTKTPAQLEEEEIHAWAITHPQEFNRLVRPLKTPQDLAESERVARAAANPQIRPAPIYEWVPIPAELRNQNKGE